MWGDVFLKQARSDWVAYSGIQKIPIDDCHKLYYLRAATEKLGKAALLISGISKLNYLSRDHKVFVKFLRASTKNPRLAKLLGIDLNQLYFQVQNVLPLAQRIENLAPQGNTVPNAEYPWQNGAGDYFIPATYKFPEVNDLSQASGRNLLKLVRLIMDNFEVVYK